MKKVSTGFVLLLLLIRPDVGLAGIRSGLGSWCLDQGQLWEGSHGRCLIGPGGTATVSEPLTIGQRQSIDIFENGRLINENQIVNNGAILSGGRIDNSGQIDSDGYILNTGLFVSDGSVNHHGSVVNRFPLNSGNRSGAEFIASGFLINQGTMVISGTLTISKAGFSNRGTISSTGTFDIQGTTVHNYSVIHNAGLIQLTFARFMNHGAVANDNLINNDDSTIYNLCQGVISGTQPVGGIVLLLGECTHLPLASGG